VAAGDGWVPDWRDAAAYEPLLGADRSLMAWEWLRRDPAYRAAADRSSRDACGSGGAGEAPERWGLHAFERPDLAAPEARPVWRAEVHPFVLAVEAHPPHGEDRFDLARLGAISTIVTAADGREHLLISDGLRSIRIDVLAGSIASGPVGLHYCLAGLETAERPLLTLRRLLALWRTGRFCRSLHPAEARAGRWLLMLRARDALAAGATQRAIAGELLSSCATRERWRVEAPSLRSQVQRLVRSTLRMAGGGFRELLL
jgi:hypothetical protein